MKVFILYLSIFVVILAQEEFYDRKYDYFDVDYLVQNPRLLKKYMDCFLDKGPCTPIGRVFKALLPEVIRTSCAKCTPSQRRFVRKTFDAFKKYLPESHTELKKKFDPENKYYEAFEKAIANV